MFKFHLILDVLTPFYFSSLCFSKKYSVVATKQSRVTRIQSACHAMIRSMFLLLRLLFSNIAAIAIVYNSLLILPTAHSLQFVS